MAVVDGASAHLGRWAKVANYCGEVKLQAVPVVHGQPGAAVEHREYSCEAGKGKIQVKQLCC